jgi:hypothetical protein
MAISWAPGGHSIEPIEGGPTPIAMVRKLVFAALILAYGAWLLTYPARTAGLHGWVCTAGATA